MITGAVVFLDKDGTLLEDVPYNVDTARMRFLPGAAEGIRLLAEAGFSLVVISNQAGVARGHFEEGALSDVKLHLAGMFREAGAEMAGFYYCPHDTEGTVADYSIPCRCRKPLPGLLIDAAAELHLSLENSWMVGDILNDVEAGNMAGCRTVFINSGHETEWLFTASRIPDVIAADFADAAETILRESGEWKIKNVS